MKLTSIEIHTADFSNVAVLSFRDPKSINPYNVKAITGLDLDTIVPMHYGSTGASNFYNQTLQNRVVVIQLALNPNYTTLSYSDLRDALYKMISTSRSSLVQLQFKNLDETICAISGLITKFETTMFDKAQGVNITVQCTDPMLRALEPDTDVGAVLTDSTISIIDDKSTAPHGVSFNLGVVTYIPSIKITDFSDLSWSFEVIPSGGFLPDDEIIFSSEDNIRTLYISREGGTVTVQLADVITPGSIWPILFPGPNRMVISNMEYLYLNSMSYYPTYWGV